MDPRKIGVHRRASAVPFRLAQIYLDSGRGADALKEVERELAIVPESRAARDLKQKLKAGK
jgi:hypothetical protein